MGVQPDEDTVTRFSTVEPDFTQADDGVEKLEYNGNGVLGGKRVAYTTRGMHGKKHRYHLIFRVKGLSDPPPPSFLIWKFDG